MTKLITPLLILLLAGGCSSKPVLPTEGANRELTAKQVIDAGKSMRGTRILWGGVIISSANLEGRTRLEILSYPLNSELRPVTDKPAGNRFLAYHTGYLETVDYAAGRQVSIVGVIRDAEESRLGEHSYHYPAIDAEKVHLWPVEKRGSDSRLHFGIGVIFSN